MKKLTLILIAFAAITFTTNAQIPNRGFENWITVGGYEDPAGGWTTTNFDNAEMLFSCSKSTDHYPVDSGIYSMKIACHTELAKYGVGAGWGMALTGAADYPLKPAFPISGHPTCLRGYYKYIPQNNDSMWITLVLFDAGTYLSGSNNVRSNAATDWIPFVIPFQSYANADSAKIMIFAFSPAQTPTPPKGNSVLYVDNLSFGYDCPDTSTITLNSAQKKCEGDSTLLQGNAGGDSYQWYINGSLIMGATNQNLTCRNTGRYVLEVTKAGCSELSEPMELQFGADKPEISILSNTILPCVGGKMVLSTTEVFSAYKWSNDTAKQTTTVSKSGKYTVTVTDGDGCHATSDPYVLNVSEASLPAICAVTVSPTSGKNVIFWDRPADEKIKKYKIYKEGTTLDQFNLLTTIDYTDFNSYTDNASNPMAESDRYGITIIDSCDIESPMSSIHKTLHLNITKGPSGEINLIWEKYEGLTIPGYVIYYGTNKSKMQVYKEISSSKESYTIFDSIVPYYQIGVKLPKICTAALKAESGPYTQSLSNIAELKKIAGDENNLDIIVYPNPADDLIRIFGIDGDATVTICNAIGQIIIEKNTGSSEVTVDVSHLPEGLYLVCVKTEKGMAVKKIMVK